MSSEQQDALSVGERDHDVRRCEFGGPGYCLTCADEALPVKVVGIDEETSLAEVTMGDTTTEIDISLVGAVKPGEWVLIHGGVALARLEEVNDGERN